MAQIGSLLENDRKHQERQEILKKNLKDFRRARQREAAIRQRRRSGNPALPEMLVKDLNTLEEEAVIMADIALEKLADGIYGDCAECGTEISVDDLKLSPFRRRCKDCEKILGPSLVRRQRNSKWKPTL